MCILYNVYIMYMEKQRVQEGESLNAFFLTTKCAPFGGWVVRIVKVGECYECQKQA